MDLGSIILCGHRNVLGCPNHGDVARDVWRALRDQWMGLWLGSFLIGDEESAPIPFELTERGHRVALGLDDGSDPLP